MKLVELKCKSCGADLKIDKESDLVVCPYCRSKYKIDDDDNDMENKATVNDAIYNNMSKSKAPVVVIMFVMVIFFLIFSYNFIRITTRFSGSVNSSIKVNSNSLGSKYNNTGSNIKSNINMSNYTGLKNIEESEKKAFNMGYELYSGTGSKIYVDCILDKVITNNKTNKDRIITVKFGKTETSDSDEITKIKKQFEYGKKYNISLDYGNNGLVNKVTIE